MVDRGRVGSMAAATERDDESYLDFVQSLRGYTIGSLNKAADGRATEVMAHYEAGIGRPATSMDEIRTVIDDVPIVASLNRFMRSSQEMMWKGVVDTYRKREASLVAELDAADRQGPGTVQWDPNFQYPNYFASVSFHIQPGSYHDDPLAGHIYHYGTKVFFTGRNDLDEMHQAMIDSIPLPSDGVVRRVLDIACSVGQASTSLKNRFPGAEVWGIDAGTPMVRYAHKRAVDLGLDVHFRQALAERTGFPDGAFDLAHSFLLFHEVPLPIGDEIAREICRVLRPGGVFAIHDLPTRTPNSQAPLRDYMTYFNRDDNGEPYIVEFTFSDFVGTLRRAGFSDVRLDQRPGGIPRWIATK
ncbi:MAG: class I SAM-dependent methyltransferase [Dehalococcoidia bacterium]